MGRRTWNPGFHAVSPSEFFNGGNVCENEGGAPVSLFRPLRFAKAPPWDSGTAGQLGRVGHAGRVGRSRVPVSRCLRDRDSGTAHRLLSALSLACIRFTRDLLSPVSSAMSRTLKPSRDSSRTRSASTSCSSRVVQSAWPSRTSSFASKDFAASPDRPRAFVRCTSNLAPCSAK